MLNPGSPKVSRSKIVTTMSSCIQDEDLAIEQLKAEYFNEPTKFIDNKSDDIESQ